MAAASAPCAEEPLQQGLGFALADATDNEEAMVEARVRGEIRHATEGTTLRIPAAEHHAPQAGVEYGADAHQARLDGHVQVCVHEAVVADGRRGRAQRQDLGVSGRVLQSNGGVASTTELEPVSDHHRSDRHLAFRAGRFRLLEADPHPFDVCRRCHHAKHTVRATPASRHHEEHPHRVVSHRVVAAHAGTS